jgi:hypothetical protein
MKGILIVAPYANKQEILGRSIAAGGQRVAVQK